MEKRFETFESQSKFTAKWWIRYTLENGEWKSMAFPTKKDRQRTINALKEQGYKQVNN